MSAPIIPSRVRAHNRRWPPPAAVRPALRAARARFHRLRVPARPCLPDPTGCVGLFTLAELVLLARCSYWPLPPRALRWLARSPAVRKARLRRWARKMSEVARRVLGREGPELFAYLRRRRRA